MTTCLTIRRAALCRAWVWGWVRWTSAPTSPAGSRCSWGPTPTRASSNSWSFSQRWAAESFTENFRSLPLSACYFFHGDFGVFYVCNTVQSHCLGPAVDTVPGHTLIKNRIKFSTYIRKFRVEQLQRHTDKKENQIFQVYKEIQNGEVAKSYMTLQLLHSEFPYTRGKFYFIFYQCRLIFCTFLRRGVTMYINTCLDPKTLKSLTGGNSYKHA